MLRRQIVVAALSICAITPWTPALAQTSPQFQVCNQKAKTQLDMDKCAGSELALRNKQMQTVYAQVLSRAAGQPATLAKIKAMQRAWMVYVYGYLAALYPLPDKQLEYGSMYPLEIALARSALVQRHILDLQGLLTKQ